MPSQSAAELFARARQSLQRGQFQQAEQFCSEILGQDARHHDALHLLGIVHARSGRPQSALGLIDQALAVRPDSAHAHNSRGNALLEQGQAQAALDAFDTATRLQPALAVAHSNRSSALLALNRPQEALAAADRAIALDSKYPPAHNNRGNALMELKQPNEALVSLDQALVLDCNFVEALTTRGSALLGLHQPQEAEASLERALQVQPHFYKARVNLSQAKLALNRPEEALEIIDAALLEHSKDPKALLSRTTILFALGRAAEAAAIALEFLDHALTLVPDHPDLLSMLGATQIRVGEIDKGIATFSRLLAIDPTYDYAIGGLLQARTQECDWTDFDATMDAVLGAVREGRRAVMPFIMASVASTPADQLQVARSFARQVMPPFRLPPPSARQANSRKLRVAYVSGDFREHPVANQIAGLLETHDRERFEIVGVALEPADESLVGQRVRKAWDEYLDLSRLDGATTAQRIRELDVDIAVDLSGSTLGNRIHLYAYRPAPIQVNFLGFPGTLASGCHDYIIADRIVLPPEHQAFYEEQVVWLPHSYQPYDSTGPLPVCHASRADEGLPEDAFVFCSFNNRFKYNPRMFDIWMRALERVPDSVLWLVSCPERVQENLRREAMHRGTDPRRLVFARRKDLRQEHIARYQLADLFLDTQPFNAHATASDALWAGLPVLTSLGECFAGRVAAGMLGAVAMPELVAEDLRHYEELAVSLANKGSALHVLRERLIQTRAVQPLFDLDGYRRALEAAYERMVATYRAGGAAASFAVPS
jgi:predicted O-linked N-acetylglucosamine transferase (SPINDLY family)